MSHYVPLLEQNPRAAAPLRAGVPSKVYLLLPDRP